MINLKHYLAIDKKAVLNPLFYDEYINKDWHQFIVTSSNDPAPPQLTIPLFINVP